MIGLNDLSDHGPGIDLDRVFIPIVPVVILPFVKGQIHLPEEWRAGFISGRDYVKEIVYDNVTEVE